MNEDGRKRKTERERDRKTEKEREIEREGEKTEQRAWLSDEPAADETHHDGLEGNVGKRGCRRYALVCHRSASVRSDKPYVRRVATPGVLRAVAPAYGAIGVTCTAAAHEGVAARERAAISEPRAAVTGFSERRDVSIIDSIAGYRYSIFRFYDDYTCVQGVCFNGEMRVKIDGRRECVTRICSALTAVEYLRFQLDTHPGNENFHAYDPRDPKRY